MCLVSLSVLFLRLTCIVSRYQYYVSFLLSNSIPLHGYTTFYLPIICLVHGNLGLFPLLIINVTTVHTVVLCVCFGYMFSFLFGSIPPINRITGSKDKYLFNLLRNCQAVFQSDRTILHYQQCRRVLIFPHSCQDLSIFFFFF